MTDDTPKPRAPRKTKWWVWLLFFAVVGIIGYDLLDLDSYRLYRIRPRLAQVQATIDPVRMAIALAYQEKGKVPQVTTVVTQANQGKPATPDWAALGFETLPSLPREASSLSLAGGGEIVVKLANIAEDINDTEVHAIPVKEAQGLSWTYTCTSANNAVKAFFRC